MKKRIVTAVAVWLVMAAVMPLSAQVKTMPKGANRFTYYQFEYGDKTDTAVVTVVRDGDEARILTAEIEGEKVQGYAAMTTTVDYAADSITMTAAYDDSAYYYRVGFARSDIDWKRETVGKGVVRYTCVVNSNTLVFEMDEAAAVGANPLPYYGLNKGVLLTYSRNGQLRMKLAKAEREKPTKGSATKGAEVAAVRVSPRELDRIMKERLVVKTRVFDHERIYWGAENSHVEGGMENIPMDTVLHFAGGTVIMKRIRLNDLPWHYQHFVEIHQESNGDAYDRTGSLFLIPFGESNFFEGMNNHPDTLPTIYGRDGERYQGMVAMGEYEPPIELVRFFTPFGVGFFNSRFSLEGMEWRNEAYYKQDITDIYRLNMGGMVYIGAWIGNYSEGHRLTVDIKSYPESYSADLDDYETTGEVMPLFNTCNVLEMAGQNYGKLFGSDSLSVTFVIPPTAEHARLRYIATGHGGWGEGDEFVPKPNSLLVDGKRAYVYTPWRGDCGTYRDMNPVSGNFWNGMSSSDLSRSGWCPGTATQPVYFDMMEWADGEPHTLTVAIPQGKPVEGMFSHWAVSGALIVEY